jgi:hypothetical protein
VGRVGPAAPAAMDMGCSDLSKLYGTYGNPATQGLELDANGGRALWRSSMTVMDLSSSMTAMGWWQLRRCTLAHDQSFMTTHERSVAANTTVPPNTINHLWQGDGDDCLRIRFALPDTTFHERTTQHRHCH